MRQDGRLTLYGIFPANVDKSPVTKGNSHMVVLGSKGVVVPSEQLGAGDLIFQGFVHMRHAEIPVVDLSDPCNFLSDPIEFVILPEILIGEFRSEKRGVRLEHLDQPFLDGLAGFHGYAGKAIK
jgi:hypothetical protein